MSLAKKKVFTSDWHLQMQKYQPVRLVFRFHEDHFEGLAWNYYEHKYVWHLDQVKAFHTPQAADVFYDPPVPEVGLDGTVFVKYTIGGQAPIYPGVGDLDAWNAQTQMGEGFIIDPFDSKYAKCLYLGWHNWLCSFGAGGSINVGFCMYEDIPF
jgi:hypothetical protein